MTPPLATARGPGLRGTARRLLRKARRRANRCGLTLRYAHRVPLHPGHYGTGLHRPSMRSTPRAVFAPALTSTCPRAPQKSRHAAAATQPPHIMPFAETARAPRSRFARKSPSCFAKATEDKTAPRKRPACRQAGHAVSPALVFPCAPPLSEAPPSSRNA